MSSVRLIRSDASESYSLDREVTVLGRDTACDIVLPDQEVSKRHARIVRKGYGYYIEDFQSTNGTRVGDRDLTGIHLLDDGDLIEIGSFRLVFSGGGPTILSALDASSTEERQLARVRPEAKLCAVLEIAKVLGGTLGLEGVLAKVLDGLFRVFPLAERGSSSCGARRPTKWS
jgi:pSer/pThr/pTyr-binding forkhead associated (FHA) protein